MPSGRNYRVEFSYQEVNEGDVLTVTFPVDYPLSGPYAGVGSHGIPVKTYKISGISKEDVDFIELPSGYHYPEVLNGQTSVSSHRYHSGPHTTKNEFK